MFAIRTLEKVFIKLPKRIGTKTTLLGETGVDGNSLSEKLVSERPVVCVNIGTVFLSYKLTETFCQDSERMESIVFLGV
jgi:hypothetical protein